MPLPEGIYHRSSREAKDIGAENTLEATGTSSLDSTIQRSRKIEWQHRLWGKTAMLADPPSTIVMPAEGEGDRRDGYTDSLPEDSAENSGPSHDSEATDDPELTPRYPSSQQRESVDPFKTPTRPRTLKTGRATTAPPQLSLRTTPPSDTTENLIQKLDIFDDTDSLSSSAESFRSFHSLSRPYRRRLTFSDVLNCLARRSLMASPYRKLGTIRETVQKLRSLPTLMMLGTIPDP